MVDFKDAIWRGSPNCWAGRQGHEPLYVVAHGTDGAFPGAVDWLTNPVSGGSVHYMVGRDGTCYQLVSEYDSAWGNGIPEEPSPFVGGANPNLYTISVETERTEGNTSAVTGQQRDRWMALLRDIRKRWGHLPLIPHSAISPHSRAHCPGPGFPMEEIDRGAMLPAPAVAPTGVVRLSAPFTATPQHLPLVFYHDWSFKRPAYTSGATKGTMLAFDQWVYGPAVRDATTGQDDYQWWHRHNERGQCGWAPSAWFVGTPPGNPPVVPSLAR